MKNIIDKLSPEAKKISGTELVKGRKKDDIEELKKAFTEFTGWDYNPPGYGYYKDIITAFTAGWNAANDLIKKIGHEETSDKDRG